MKLWSNRIPLIAWFALPVVVSLFILVNFVLPQYIDESLAMRPNQFALPIADSTWNVFYGDAANGTVCAEGKELCPADRRFAELWQGPLRHGVIHAETLKNMPGRTYWIGRRITLEEQRRAVAAQADRFFIGSIYGSFEVYVNGKLKLAAGLEHTRDPVIVPLEIQQIPQEEIFVSLKIRNELNEPWPDSLHFSGIGTAHEIQMHQRWDVLTSAVKNSMAVGFNLALGVLFLAFWLCNPLKQEIAAFAGFALLHAVVQAGTVPLVWDRMGTYQWHLLNFVTCAYEGLFVLLVGFALARLRSKVTILFSLLFMVAPWSIYFTNLAVVDIFNLDIFLWRYWTTCCYFVAAGICCWQALVVQRKFRHLLQDNRRLVKLFFSCGSLLVMGSVHYFAGAADVDPRIMNSALLAVLSVVVIHEYQRQESQARKTPMSKYHMRIELPPAIPCVLCVLDIKSSESLFQTGITKGLGGSYVQSIIDGLSNVVTSSGAEIIQAEGDALAFFLPMEGPAKQLARATDILLKCDSHLRDQNIYFRAAISEGEIKPLWQEIQGQRRPAWAQAGNSNVFVENARLLEAEKLLKLGECSVLITMKSTLDRWSNDMIEYHWTEWSQPVPSKHGKQIDIALLKLASLSKQDQRRLDCRP